MSISNSTNGNYLVNCAFFRSGNDTASAALLSLTSFGEVEFLKQYIENDYRNTIRQIINSNDGYLLVGWTQEFEPGNFVRTYHNWVDEYGNSISSYQTGSDIYMSGIYTGFRHSDGGYLLGGFIRPYLNPPFRLEPYIVKLNIEGQEQWTYTYNNYNYSNWVQDMLPSEDGGAYLLLQTNFYVGGGDMALLHIDSLGNIIWEKNYDFNPHPELPEDTYGQCDYARSIIRTSDVGFLITAMIDTIIYEIPAANFFIFASFGAVIKTDSIGNVEWMNFEHNGQNSLSTASCQLSDSSYVLCGSRLFPVIPGEPQDQMDVELFKLDPQGNTLWTRFYGGAFNDYAYDMIPTPDDGFILCGRKEFIDYAADTGMAYVYVIKTNCMGLLTQPQAAFTYAPLDEALVQFINQTLYAYPDSIDGGYYIWDFGDGSPPYLCGQGYTPCTAGNTLTHQYPNPGTYTATLTAIVCSDTSMVQALVDTQGAGGTVGTAENSPSVELLGVVVYPNPAQNTLQITISTPLVELVETSITLYSLTGQPILQTTLAAGEVSKTISVAHLPVGLYLYVVEQQGNVVARGKVAVLR